MQNARWRTRTHARWTSQPAVPTSDAGVAAPVVARPDLEPVGDEAVAARAGARAPAASSGKYGNAAVCTTSKPRPVTQEVPPDGERRSAAGAQRAALLGVHRPAGIEPDDLDARQPGGRRLQWRIVRYVTS